VQAAGAGRAEAGPGDAESSAGGRSFPSRTKVAGSGAASAVGAAAERGCETEGRCRRRTPAATTADRGTGDRAPATADGEAPGPADAASDATAVATPDPDAEATPAAGGIPA